MNMSQNPPFRLEGLSLANGWEIGDMVEKKPEDTGGNFSVGYLCKGPAGEDGFLKAIDLYRPLSGLEGDIIEILTAFLEEVRGERELLNASRTMDRVVTAIETGDIRELNGENLNIVIPYIIFERADSSVRRHVHSGLPPHSWCLRTLHQMAVGLWQLHGSMIAHQDLKLSNVLLFGDEGGAKLSDLGRSVQQGRSVPHEQMDWPGDRGYAPPEFAYGYEMPEFIVRRFAADLYLLGSCACAIFTGASFNAILYDQLPNDFHPIWQKGSYQGTFEEVLPHLQEAFQSALSRVAESISEDASYSEEVLRMLAEWCNPDPHGRGDPRTRAIKLGGNIYSLERYLSRLDLLASRAAVDERRRARNGS